MRRSLILAVVISLAATAASAAPKAENLIEACRDESATDADRIACLEGAIVSLAGKKSGKKEKQAATEPATLPAAADGAPTIADASEPAGLGAEQVKARQRDRSDAEREDKEKKPREVANVRITEVVYSRAGKALFFMEDGQIWREVDKDDHGRRVSTKKQYSAEITQSMFGGYRMKIDGVVRMFAVERLK